MPTPKKPLLPWGPKKVDLDAMEILELNRFIALLRDFRANEKAAPLLLAAYEQVKKLTPILPLFPEGLKEEFENPLAWEGIDETKLEEVKLFVEKLAAPGSFYFDVFVTACEGGCDYWAEVKQYKIWLPKKPGLELQERTQTAEAVFVYDDPNSGEPRQTRITLLTILNGLLRMRRENTDGAKAILEAWAEWDAGEIDAGGADYIVQMALFGELTFS